MSLDLKTTNWLRKFTFLISTCFAFVLLQSQYAFGQVDEGSITGTVQDTTGAVVANAQVRLLNTDQGTTLQTRTDASGVYTFAPVRIGNYIVSATAPGFAETNQQNLTLNVSQVLMVNIQLKPGARTEIIQVTTAPPVLQTEEASVGQVVDERTKNNLPLNGRNWIFLAQLGAGMQTRQADTRGFAATGAFSANGLKSAQNNFMLDGIDNNNYTGMVATNFVILPPIEAIQEFKVQTADFSAEQGRSSGAVINATIKSGTNSFRGAVWEYFRNDKLDAADYFEKVKKGVLRQNQFGGTLGGPILKNRVFFFGDYEGLQRVQGNTQSGLTVPTVLERNSNYTNLSDLVTGTARSDLLGRKITPGTILDPATTRQVTSGQIDPVSGLTATANGYVRDPFGTCNPGTITFTTAACNLNQIPANRLDANAVKMMNLYPLPTASGVTNNFQASPHLYEHRNAFDLRFDFNFSPKDQAFYRFSWENDPMFIPGPFGGIADGGIYAQGVVQVRVDADALAYTHVFTPTMINVARIGFNHYFSTRWSPVANELNVPAQFGIQGIPQLPHNGGLPTITISGLSSIGGPTWLPGIETGIAEQFSDDFTKILGRHSLKAGVEILHGFFNNIMIPASRGTFDFNGTYTDVVNLNSSTTGRAQFLLTPVAATVANGVNYSGGSDAVTASNMQEYWHERKYLAPYVQDDWKVSPKLTLNLGLRWEYFDPILEKNGAQADFVPYGGPQGNTPVFIIPATGKAPRVLSSTANTPSLAGNGFLDLLAKDGITLLSTDAYGNGMVQTPMTNFGPRVGIAYQVTRKLVVRAGGGLFFNQSENYGSSPDLAENYPFIFSFSYAPLVASGTPTGYSAVAPISYSSPYAGCATATNTAGTVTGTATLEAGLSCTTFSSALVNASSLAMQGLQFHYQTPRNTNANLTFQYSLTHNMSLQVAYVMTDMEHEESGHGNNNVTSLLPPGANVKTAMPFPDFARGAGFRKTEGHSMYNGLQTKLEQQYSNGLNFLLAYTWSKALSDAGDQLDAGGTAGGFRAADIPGYGPKYDWTYANFDLPHVIHFSGGYQLPFGWHERFLNRPGMLDRLVGGWSINWLTTLQGGQPVALTCPTATTTGSTCYVVEVAGQDQKLGLHTDTNGKLSWYGNPAAFAQPCAYGSTTTPAGCVAGANALGGNLTATRGPGFHRLDFSTFKAIELNDKLSMQFRAEFFNILNHPNFNSPNFSGNGVLGVANSGNFTNANFGEIGSTRDAPYDPRQIQFAAKLFF